MKVAVDITRKSHLNLRERVKSTQNHIAKQAQANSKMLAWLFGRRNIASCSLWFIIYESIPISSLDGHNIYMPCPTPPFAHFMTAAFISHILSIFRLLLVRVKAMAKPQSVHSSGRPRWSQKGWIVREISIVLFRICSWRVYPSFWNMHTQLARLSRSCCLVFFSVATLNPPTVFFLGSTTTTFGTLTTSRDRQPSSSCQCSSLNRRSFLLHAKHSSTKTKDQVPSLS